MTAMAVNKVVYGNNTLIDISRDTVTAETLASGVTAHNARGEAITGTMTAGGGGVVGKPYIDTSQITDFRYFCSHNKLNSSLDKIDTSNGINFSYMFYASTALATIPQLDTSKGTNFANMFYGCTSLVTVPTIDISTGVSFTAMFNGCANLQTVSFTKPTNNFSQNSFHDCTALQNITVGKGWAYSIYLHYSEQLTQASLHGMIENLADLTGKTAKTFQVGTTNIAKIDASHIAMLQAKNWSYS